jgi:CRP-like cAMP-binding protein
MIQAHWNNLFPGTSSPAKKECAMTIKSSRVVRSGERTNPAGKPVGNKLLLAMNDKEFRLIRPHLEFLDMPHHSILHEPHRRLKAAYFPNNGLISLVVVLNQGKTVEAGLVGNEGATGVPGLVGLERSSLREVIQVAGDGFRVKTEALRVILPSLPVFQMMLSRYAVILGMQIAQTAACNRLHGVHQRLSRWLLLTQDRVDSGFLPITHDFLATMLGTDRPSVTLAANKLQKMLLIEYVRGAVKILDRKELESVACECYAAIKQYGIGH